LNKPETVSAQERPWQSVGLLLDAARPEKPHLIRGGLWLVVAAALEVLAPILGKRYIDHHLLPGNYDIAEMATLLALVLLTGWAASWIRYAQLSRMAGVARRSVLRLRECVYAHVLALPMAYFDKAITGQLVSRVTNDTEAVNQLYRQVLYVMLDSTIVVIGSLVAMAWLDWRLMLIVATLVPAMVVIVLAYQRLSAPAVSRTRQLRSDINAQMAESMAGMAVLQASGAAGRFGERFGATNAEHRLSRIAELRANAWLLRPALDLMNVLLLVTVIYSFGHREIAGPMGAIEVGLLYAFLAYIARVVEPLIQITMQFGQLQQSMVAASRVRTLLQEDEQRGPAQVGHPVTGGAIRI
jgi:ATP-binding cassette subfamily B multidrug efflux pump